MAIADDWTINYSLKTITHSSAATFEAFRDWVAATPIDILMGI